MRETCKKECSKENLHQLASRDLHGFKVIFSELQPFSCITEIVSIIPMMTDHE